MRVFSRLALAATLTWLSATVPAAQATTAAAGKILFTRHMLGETSGYYYPSGVALYSVHADGSHLHRLTPFQQGHLYLPGVESDTSVVFSAIAIMNWLAKNFSPSGRGFLYFKGVTSTFPIQQYSVSGKYKVRDATGHSHDLFPGDDDVAAGYGYLTWGPPGSREVAYTNAAEDHPSATPCVFLVHPDGSDAHPLWCPQGYGTAAAVTNLRWSGNGKYLLAYVSQDPEYPSPPNFGWYRNADLWRVDVATGNATRVSTEIYEPHLGDSADISYDGNKIVYQQYTPYESDTLPCDPEAPDLGSGYTICLRDMTTGQTTVLGEGDTSKHGQLALSPDGTRLAVARLSTSGTYWETDLYLINTADGTVIRQLTHVPSGGLPAGSSVDWLPVAWSSDGTRLLANRYYTPESSHKPPKSGIYVINVGKATARYVTAGHAEDWYQPDW